MSITRVWRVRTPDGHLVPRCSSRTKGGARRLFARDRGLSWAALARQGYTTVCVQRPVMQPRPAGIRPA